MGMSDVAYRDPKLGTSYGLFHNFLEENQNLARQNKGVIEHLIYPWRRTVSLDDIRELPAPDYKNYFKYDEATGLNLEQGESGLYKALMQLLHEIREDRLEGDELQAGHQFAIGVGDGYAHYVVTKIARTRCTVEWRGWCGDRWHDHHFGWGGQFSKRDVSRYVFSARHLNNLFSGNRDRGKARIEKFPELYRQFRKEYGFIPNDVQEYVDLLHLKV